MTNAPQNIIGLLISPVLMISACGLLCLTYYNRMAILVARIRAFNSERLNLLEKRIAHQHAFKHDELDTPHRARTSAVDQQVQSLLHRARLIRRTLVCLVLCIICMLTSSLSLGMSLILTWFDAVSLVVFIVGVVSLLIGMVMALLELRLSLTPVALEEDFLAQLAVDTNVSPVASPIEPMVSETPSRNAEEP